MKKKLMLIGMIMIQSFMSIAMQDTNQDMENALNKLTHALKDLTGKLSVSSPETILDIYANARIKLINNSLEVLQDQNKQRGPKNDAAHEIVMKAEDILDYSRNEGYFDKENFRRYKEQLEGILAKVQGYYDKHDIDYEGLKEKLNEFGKLFGSPYILMTMEPYFENTKNSYEKAENTNLGEPERSDAVHSLFLAIEVIVGKAKYFDIYDKEEFKFHKENLKPYVQLIKRYKDDQKITLSPPQEEQLKELVNEFDITAEGLD